MNNIYYIITQLADLLISFDISISQFMEDLTRNVMPSLADIGFVITNIGDTKVIAIVSVLIGVVFIARKQWAQAIIMILPVGIAGILVHFLKDLFMRVRPENALQILNDYSFPSGHATMAAVFFAVIIYLFAPKIHSWIKRELFIVVCVLGALLIGLSRIVLNVHWASDIIAGWSLGVFCATAGILLVRYVSVLIINRNVEK